MLNRGNNLIMDINKQNNEIINESLYHIYTHKLE